MAMNTEVDAGQHLALLNFVVGRMGFRGDEAEEAFSEGLIHLTKAARTYEPERGSLSNWLVKNLQWELRSWRAKEHRRTQLTTSASRAILSALQGCTEPSEARSELSEVLGRLEGLLTPTERQIILYGAVGYSGREIAKKLAISPVQVSRAKNSAQRKLRQI